MGSVSDPTAGVRFGSRTERYTLVDFKVSFAGGTGSASIVLKLDASETSEHAQGDKTLFTFESAGTTGDNPNINFRIDDSERDNWTFPAGQMIVAEWTNPDDGNMEWDITAVIETHDA